MDVGYLKDMFIMQATHLLVDVEVSAAERQIRGRNVEALIRARSELEIRFRTGRHPVIPDWVEVLGKMNDLIHFQTGQVGLGGVVDIPETIVEEFERNMGLRETDLVQILLRLRGLPEDTEIGLKQALGLWGVRLDIRSDDWTHNRRRKRLDPYVSWVNGRWVPGDVGKTMQRMGFVLNPEDGTWTTRKENCLVVENRGTLEQLLGASREVAGSLFGQEGQIRRERER